MTGLRALDRRRRSDGGVGDVVIVVLGVVAALAVVLTMVLVAVRGERSAEGPRGAGALDALDGDLTAAGLTVCRRDDGADPRATAAVASRTLVVGSDCTAARGSTDTGATNGTAVVQSDLFADLAARDAAARAIEGLARPRASSSVRTWGDLVVVVRGGGDEAVVRRVDAALRTAGAR